METHKISTEDVRNQYRSGIQSYKDFTLEVGLWESEKYVFEKYLERNFQILDIGCGTGRTTFGLYQKGYTNIIGLDLTPEMIAAAEDNNKILSLHLEFVVGDATDLKFEDEKFDAAIFSFNGVMSIPKRKNRLKAFVEISRVLKHQGVFIFTTHDRAKDEKFFEFWLEEEKKWKEGKQRTDLYEFGDLVTTSKNETGEIFIHIPDMQEVEDLIKQAGFELTETFYREEKFDEPEKVKMKSGECRFWVVRKIGIS